MLKSKGMREKKKTLVEVGILMMTPDNLIR